MFSQIFDAIEEWMRELLTGMITSNLDTMFTDVNQKTGEIATQVGQTPQAKNLTQEELAGLVNLSPTHVSVIERGLKVTKLDTFIAIANALDVSADTLLIDVVTHSVSGVTNELSEMIEKLPKEKQQRIINAVRALVE